MSATDIEIGTMPEAVGSKAITDLAAQEARFVASVIGSWLLREFPDRGGGDFFGGAEESVIYGDDCAW